MFLEASQTQDPCDLCAEVQDDRDQIARLQAQVSRLQRQINSQTQQIAALQQTNQDCNAQLQSQQTFPDVFQSPWTDLCPGLGQQIDALRQTARNYLNEVYVYLEIDIPMLYISEIVREKNLYCFEMGGNSFLELGQSSSPSTSLWNLSQNQVFGNVDYQQMLSQVNQALQQMQVFVAIDQKDCQERLDSYLDDTTEYYNNLNKRIEENMQGWLLTYQTQLQGIVNGMPYCADTEYEDLEQLINSLRVLT